MKWFHTALAVLGFAQIVMAASAGTYVPVATEALFVPRGFDDNDDIVVSLSGNFPSTCYQLAHTELKTEIGSSRILIQQMAYMTSGPCSRILVPFTNTVHLGRLPAGNYTIQSAGNPGYSVLPVTRAKVPSQDDYLYAPIMSANVLASNGQLVAYLEGRLTNSCLKIKGVYVTYTGATIQILPIMELMKRQEDGGSCRTVDRPLRLTKALSPLNRGQYLLHVRSLNGRSLNVVFHVDR